MSLWALVAAMAALTIVLLVRPLLRVRHHPTARLGAPDLAVYRAQLTELQNELALGLISRDAATAARAEIERRMLATDRDAEPAEARASDGRGRASRGKAYAIALVAAASSGAVALYLTLGTPGLPSMSFGERQTASGQSADDVALLVERLAARLEANPQDQRGWLLLARSYAGLRRFAEAAEAYRRAIELGSNDPPILAAYGETLVGAADGVVSPQARDTFEAAVAREPENPRARYYLGLAAAQAGDLRAAFDRWYALAGDTPVEAPWRAALEAQLRRVAAELGIAIAEIPVAVDAAPPADESGSPAP